MKKLVLVLMVLGMVLPTSATTIIEANDDVCTLNDGTNYDEAYYAGVIGFGLFVKYPNNRFESYVEFTLDTTPASEVTFQLYQADVVDNDWTVGVSAAEYDFDETTLAYALDVSGWTDLGNLPVIPASAPQGYYSIDVTDWYNDNLGKTMTLCLHSLAIYGNSGPIFEDREGTYNLYDGNPNNTAEAGPQLIVVPEPATMALLGLGALALRRKRA